MKRIVEPYSRIRNAIRRFWLYHQNNQRISKAGGMNAFRQDR